MNLQKYGQHCVWALALLAGTTAMAAPAPAPWYWWRSLHDGQRVCAQHMPSQGWKRAQGPFNNAQCHPKPAAFFPAPR